MDPDRTIWSGRPCPGLAWRPGDLYSSIAVSLWAAIALFMSYGASWLFFAVALLFSSYMLAGRFYHDAALRRRIRYELSARELTVWIEGRDVPECAFEISASATSGRSS